MPAYVAEPAGTPRGGAIVIQEIFGITQPMKNVADLLAGEGYLAIVPALYHRIDPNFSVEYNDDGIKRGIDARDKTTIADATADLEAAATYLRERLGPGAKIGAWGFCFGGTIAYLAATLPFIDASVSFYGGQIAAKSMPDVPAMVDLTPEIRTPLLLAFGADDHSIPAEAIDAIRTALAAEHKSFELTTYPEAGHGFFRPGPESSPAATQAWSSVKAFLAANIGA